MAATSSEAGNPSTNLDAPQLEHERLEVYHLALRLHADACEAIATTRRPRPPRISSNVRV